MQMELQALEESLSADVARLRAVGAAGVTQQGLKDDEAMVSMDESCHSPVTADGAAATLPPSWYSPCPHQCPCMRLLGWLIHAPQRMLYAAHVKEHPRVLPWMARMRQKMSVYPAPRQVTAGALPLPHLAISASQSVC